MIKNDPYALLNESGVAKNLLSDKAKEALSIYDETLEGIKEFPEDKALKDMAKQIGKAAVELLQEDIEKIKAEINDDEKTKEKKRVQKAQSKKIVEKADKTMDYLKECRIKLREDRKRKIAAGEIKAPVKKKLTTKLKEAMKKIIGMMPKAAQQDEQKIIRTEQAMQIFLSELKCIWGMNKIKPIADELKEKFDGLKEKVSTKKE
ncbi:MAG: hypothetical protein CMD31_13170 [Flavobacteriales bacterium]|nr:hypothetical protein [Flavobacteriales bacterium]|tara:strand:- start:53138 stop:53752 length:615 start_codon:yes stop_codon:yes gene_type:complete